MVSFEEAQQLVLNSFYLLDNEKVKLIEALDRTLAEDIVSDINMPPFNKSAMDGYACKMSDINFDLEVIETIRAGKFPQKEIKSGQCSKIMTGAAVPKGADCVVQNENCEITESGKIKILQTPYNSNISLEAEDVKIGDIVLSKGTIVRAHHISILAAAGYDTTLVSCLPKTGIIVTGDELVEPHQKPMKSQIRNSNAWQLMAQTKKIGIESKYYGIVADDQQTSFEVINMALNENDIIIITGGISQGDFDMIPKALQINKIDIIFDSIAVQPGKPTTFGIKDKKRIFGLPGNPVSSLLQFELLVKPLINKMMGAIILNNDLFIPFGKDFTRKKSDRRVFLPVIYSADNTIILADYNGSAHIGALKNVFGFISLAPGQTSIKKGEFVHVRPI